MTKPIIIKRLVNTSRVFIKIDDEYFCVYDNDSHRCIYACDNKLRVFTDIYWITRYNVLELIESKTKFKAAICRR